MADLPLLPPWNGCGFPRIAHLSWKTENIPSYWQETFDSWHRLHPGWTIVLWTDKMLDAFVAARFPERMPKYRSYKHNIMRVDFSRYCLMQAVGGLYMDMDICPVTSLEPMVAFYEQLGGNVVLSESAAGHGSQSLTNAFLLSKPGAKFWDVVWEVLQDPYGFSPGWKRLVGPGSRHFSIIFTTGPGVVNEALREYRKRFPPRADDGCTDVHVVPKNFLQHTPHWKTRPSSSPGALTKLLKGGSWHKLDSQMATAADQAWSARDTWGAVLIGVFFAATVVLAVFVGLQAKKLKQREQREVEDAFAKDAHEKAQASGRPQAVAGGS